MPRRGFPSLTSGGRTPSYHTRRNPPSDYPAATVTGGRALPNSLAALSRIRWPTRAEICTCVFLAALGQNLGVILHITARMICCR